MADYSKQETLIVNNFPELRLAIKREIQQLGINNIEIASDGKAAIRLCQQKSYDIIFSDYRLGEGKDGQQVLEELSIRELLKPTTIFIMITADNTTEMVMAAIEHTPDIYLTIPLNREQLKSRLDKLLHKKAHLEPIYRAIITKNYPKAIQLAKRLLTTDTPYQMACLRIIADLYMKMADLHSAHKVYNQVLAERPIPWALLGLGELQFLKADYSAATDNFQAVLKQLPDYPLALEWLAKIQAIRGDSSQAQSTLQKALAISPRVTQRQEQLGRLARQNKNYEVARRAFRAAIKTSKDSVFRSPEHYFNLVQVLTEELTATGGLQNKRLSAEAFACLNDLETAYSGDDELKLRIAICRHALNHKLQRRSEIDRYMNLAKELFDKLGGEVSGIASTDMAGAYLREEDYAKCQALLASVMEKFADDEQLMATIESIIDDKTAFNRAVEASVSNNLGIRAHADNNLQLAVEYFESALKVTPENASFTMNLVQVLLKIVKQADDKEALVQAQTLLDNCAHLDNKDYRYLRYQQLSRMLSDIQIGH